MNNSLVNEQQVLVHRSTDEGSTSTAQGFVRLPIFCSSAGNFGPISMERVILGKGEESCSHAHVGTHTVVYTVSGRNIVYFGANLEFKVEVSAGDWVYIPPGAIHYVTNPYEVPMVAIVVRSPPSRQIIEYPNLLP